MRLTLSRAGEADLPALVPVMFRAFSKLEVFDALMGRQTDRDQALALERLRSEVRNDRADVWLKVVDQDSGRVVAGSNWKVVAGWGDAGKYRPEDHQAEWLHEGSVERVAAESIQKQYYERRVRSVGEGPNVHVNILFCDPDYQKNGAGFMMLNWACQLADHLDVPMWVEASAVGHKVYETCGFRDVEVVADPSAVWTHDYFMMKREPRKGAFLGETAANGIAGKLG